MAVRDRSKDHTCNCKAYRFPHRFGGGKCKGLQLAQDHWDIHWGHDSTCMNCNNFDENTHSCEVLDGGAPIRTCEVVIEFVVANEIKYRL